MENERNKKQNRPNRQNGQKSRKKFRNGENNTDKSNDKDQGAGTSGVGKRKERNNNNNFEAKNPIGYKILEAVLKSENHSELILKLSSVTNGFLLRLDQQSIEPGFMCLILSALAKASQCSTELNTTQLLVHFYMKLIPKLNNNSNFQRELKLFIANLSTYCATFTPLRARYVTAIQDLLIFLRRLQLTTYQKSFDAVSNFMQLITAQINHINRKGNCLNDYIVETMNQLNESVEKYEEMREETEQTEVLMEPPDDFRRIGIYPDTFDILSNHEPFIRKSIVDGKYVGGVDHYLDIQFRLLREDFVRPLREGITQYRHIKSKPEEMAASKFRISDLNIYQNVQICGSKMLRNQQVHFCKFDCKPFRHLRWQYNKRMITGSLVCLSPDDFETFFFATVAGQRDPDKLAKGEFQIKLEMENSATTEITPFITYVMVESQVYFEAYRHNLKVLQGFGKDNFPLQQYIVDVNKRIAPPSYLTNESTYLMSNGLPPTDPEYKMLPVDMLSDREWPPCEDFRLDESQYEAFRAALTKQLVVIQGPPGTGKTYIGLRIVEVLLANTSQWPILIVCYTNHALDQFLEGILKFCGPNELVRIGGKSQCEVLDKYNLSSIKSNMKARREVPSYIHKTRSESSYMLKAIQEQISNEEKKVQRLTDSVLGYELEEVIRTLNNEHYLQLRALADGRRLNEGLLNWLGYAVNTENDVNNKDNDIDMDANIEVAEEVFEEPEIDEEDIKALEEERLIYQSSDEDDDDDNELSDHSESPEPINLNDIVLLEDADGFRLQKNQRKQIKNRIKREIKKSESMPRDQAQAIRNINALLPNDRWNLYRLWIKIYMEQFEENIKLLREEYRNECLRFDGLRKQEDIEIVKKAKIIGMTTTGAAKYRHIIDGTEPKITVVEEAAEVLEAHIVTALCKHTDHLILIGDHLQLRPNPAVYELAKKFNLEISLFERFIKNQLEYYQLKQQHRMRPCISSLLVPHIYKQLLDHPSVEKYGDVKGISKNMFFINHRQNEITMQETRSHKNIYEAEFIVELCRYVVLQGYEASQVTILTTYSGQLHQIRQLMRGQRLLCGNNGKNGVRAAVVDNYQGEESDIILLSFVRSNEEGNIGFLKDSHRVNVALSRARKGLYCIGNFDCLAEKSPLWQNIMMDLTAQEAIGNALEIYCQNHTDQKNLVNSKGGFDVAPEGGCLRPCDYRLPCGHSCTSMCHIADVEHVDLYKKCHKSCDKIVCDLNHRCTKRCHFGEDCGDCKVTVQKLRPECQHMVRVSCSGNPSLAHCLSKCERSRSCGHKCRGICNQICDTTICSEMVQVKSPCGHMVTIKCSNANKNMEFLLNACPEPCGVVMQCGHPCKGSCGRCKLGRLHISCEEKCTRILVCGHPCSGKCSIDCAPCKKKCMNSCVHSKCSAICGAPCPPCMEKCTWQCEHLKCSKLCHEPCDRELCVHPDTRLIRKCGHPSIGVCGEKIPRLCRVCNQIEIFLGNEEEPNARFIQLEDCSHTFEVNDLVKWMKTEPESDDRNPQSISNSIQFKKCPQCSTIIRKTKSLNTFIQASLNDIQQVKRKTCGDPKVNRATQSALFQRVKGILDNGSLGNDPLRLINIYRDIIYETKFKSKYHGTLPNQTLIELTNKLDLLEALRAIGSAFEGRQKSQENLSAETIEKFNIRIRMAASFIENYKNCDQQRDDISTEMMFLQSMCDVIVKASQQPFNDTGKQLLNEAFGLANAYGTATESIRKAFQAKVAEACKHSSGLGITTEERQMILKAMGFGRGHWYKCRNGHVYAIGECGGAMQRSTCPECGSAIGGEAHALDRSNALATEMDGATHAAWPIHH